MSRIEDWQRVWALFEEAANLPPEARASFLARECDSPDTSRLIEELIEADSEVDAVLDQSPVDCVTQSGVSRTRGPTTATDPEDDPVRVGPYRIVRRVGEGGMAVAFLAERDDDVFDRLVVVKVVRRDLIRGELIRRLRAERQMLAGLEHPNIARLYDGGTTDDGLPYFAMEYVEGVSVDQYCEQRQLSIEARLELMGKICSAVHFAHQNLIVHRDIKPSNILVREDGEPKLLDFGIAKIIAEAGDPEQEPTATWARPLTPSYASPEQIQGLPVTTSSDVYGLGVLFYRLLTGQLPHQMRGRTLPEMARILEREEPTRPSTVIAESSIDPSSDERPPTRGVAAACGLAPQALRKRLSGDLDAIVMKALRPEPHERYESAAQVAADIGRHLTGQPVLARRGTWRYLTSSFVRRHRTAVSLSAMLVLALVGLTVTLFVESARVARERDQARLERDKTRRVLGVMLDVFRSSDPFEGEASDVTVREALAHNTPSLELQLADQPELLGAVLHATGSIYLNLADHERARETLGRALSLRTDALGPDHPDVAVTQGRLAASLREIGDYDDAEGRARQAVALLRVSPDDRRSDYLDALNQLTSVLCYRGDYTRAEASAVEAVALGRELEGADRLASAALINLAVVRNAQTDYRTTVDLYREGLEVLESQVGTDHASMSAPLINLGMALVYLDRYSEAADAYRQAIRILESNVGADHPSLAPALNNFASVLSKNGDNEGAEAMYRRALKIFAAAVGTDHPRILFLESRAALAQALRGTQNARAAEPGLRAALDRFRPQLGDRDWMIALAETSLGSIIALQGRDREAETLLVDGFMKLLESGQRRFQDEGFRRLESFFHESGRSDELAPYRALLDARDS